MASALQAAPSHHKPLPTRTLSIHFLAAVSSGVAGGANFPFLMIARAYFSSFAFWAGARDLPNSLATTVAIGPTLSPYSIQVPYLGAAPFLLMNVFFASTAC